MERRTFRVTEAQWQVLIEFLELNPNLVRGYNNSSQGRRDSTRLWEEIAGMLNAQGSGASKTPKEWSVYVSNHKSKLKKMVAVNTRDAGGTGGGPPQGRALSETDTRFLAILGEGFGQAAPQVRVNPFPVSIEPERILGQSPPILEQDNDNVIFEVVETSERHEDSNEMPGDIPVDPILQPLSPSGAAAPSLPRKRRQTRVRTRPLAPLDEARRILSQVEMQRAAADAAMAQAMEMVGHNLGRLADIAERYVNYFLERH